MKWNKFRIETTTEAEDLVSSMLMDLGIQGIEIEDNIPMSQREKEQMFVDILPETGVDDGVAYISFYLEEEDDKEAVLAKVRAELEDMRAYIEVGSGSIEESQTEDVDWVNNWKKYFHQFYVDDILIIPSWENVKPEVDLYILGVFDEEAEREDERQTESEKETCAHLLAMLAVNREDDGEDDEVGYGLIQLSGMARIGVYTLEDKGPGHIGHVADNLRVHEVSYSDECRRDARHHSKVV